MKAKYRSHVQAFAMCHDYQHLHGAPPNDQHGVDLILVAPCSRILQWKYVQDILREEGDIGTLTADHPAGRYDVLLVSMVRR